MAAAALVARFHRHRPGANVNRQVRLRPRNAQRVRHLPLFPERHFLPFDNPQRHFQHDDAIHRAAFHLYHVPPHPLFQHLPAVFQEKDTTGELETHHQPGANSHDYRHNHPGQRGQRLYPGLYIFHFPDTRRDGPAPGDDNPRGEPLPGLPAAGQILLFRDNKVHHHEKYRISTGLHRGAGNHQAQLQYRTPLPPPGGGAAGHGHAYPRGASGG